METKEEEKEIKYKGHPPWWISSLPSSFLRPQPQSLNRQTLQTIPHAAAAATANAAAANAAAAAATAANAAALRPKR